MTILLNNDGHWHDKYLAALAHYLPDRKAVEFGADCDPSEIDYAIIWKHPDGDLLNYPNLKAVFSLGSGTDYLDAYNAFPDVPVFRMIDPNMAEDMALYTLYWVIHFQRGMDVLRGQQKEGLWKRYVTPLAHEVKVCVLGQGAIGGHIAQVLSRNGYVTFGWSRSEKNFEDVQSISGEDSLLQILPEMDIVVSMLPSNRSTRNYLNKDIFAAMKRGSAFINISRGAVVDEDDLLAALDSGQISAAALDVFHQEPLPKNSAFWSHPKVHVTPHMSGATNPFTSIKIIAENLKKFEKGIMPDYQYVREV